MRPLLSKLESKKFEPLMIKPLSPFLDKFEGFANKLNPDVSTIWELDAIDNERALYESKFLPLADS